MKNLFLCSLVCFLFSPTSFAEIDHKQHELVYIDPLMVEHAFLENKLRFDFGYQNRNEFERQDQEPDDEGSTTREGKANITRYGFTGEWILSERIGVGVETALLQVDAFEHSNTVGFGDTELELKVLPWIDEERQFVSALSFGLGIPTGNEEDGLGEGRVELEPALLLFKTWGGLVMQGQYAFAVELGSGQEPAFFKYNQSFSYPFALSESSFVKTFIPMFETLGTLPLNGASEGENQFSLVPGFRVGLPLETSIGFGFKFPVGRHTENEAELLATLSKHFD